MEKNWTTHAEFIVLLVTLIGGFYLLDGKIERQGERTDRLYEQLQSTTCQQSARSDQLYQMFVDLLKEKSKCSHE